jgi:hypothetical protein
VERKAPAPAVAPAPVGTAREPTAPPVPDNGDALDSVEVAPRQRNALARLRAHVTAKKGEITAALSAARQAVAVRAAAGRESATQEVGALTARLSDGFDAAEAEVRAHIAEQTGAVRAAIVAGRAEAATATTGQSTRLGVDGHAHATTVRAAGTDKATATRELGRTEAQRARDTATGHATDAAQRGQGRVGAITDADPDRAAARAQAVRQVGTAQADELRRVAPPAADFALTEANRIAAGIGEQTTKVAAEVDAALPGGQHAIRDIGAAVQDGLDTGATGAIEALNAIETRAVQELRDLRAATLATARELGGRLVVQVDAVERAALDQAGHGADLALRGLDDAALATLGRPSGFTAVDSVATQTIGALDALDATVGGEFDTVIVRGRTAGTELEGTARGGIEQAQAGVRQGTATVTARVQEGVDRQVRQGREAATGSADQLLTALADTSGKTVAEVGTTHDRSRATITDGVTDSLAHNDSALASLDGNLARAEAEAEREYDRPAWQKVLLAIGKAVLYLAAAILATLVIAAVIFVGALILAKFGIVAAISFTAAVVIAAVVLAVGALLYECVTRAQAYRAEHGPTSGFWQTLGVTAGIVLASVGSLVGLTQIIEGARGKRFFSNREMSSQEQYDLVVGGIFQIFVLFFGGRIVRSLRASPKPVDPPPPPVRPPPVEEPPVRPPPVEEPPTPVEKPPVVEEPPVPNRSLGLRQEAVNAIAKLENLKRNPVGEINREPNHNHYSAARREARGEVVARRSDGRPFSHIRDLQEACDGLFKVREALTREAHNPPDTMTERGMTVLLERLSEVNRLINRLAGFLNEVGHGSFPPYHEWPPGS